MASIYPNKLMHITRNYIGYWQIWTAAHLLSIIQLNKKLVTNFVSTKYAIVEHLLQMRYNTSLKMIIKSVSVPNLTVYTWWLIFCSGFQCAKQWLKYSSRFIVRTLFPLKLIDRHQCANNIGRWWLAFYISITLTQSNWLPQFLFIDSSVTLRSST